MACLCSQPQHQGSSWARESPASFPRHHHHNHHSHTRSMWCVVVYCCGVGEKGSGVPSGERWREGRTGHRPARDKKFPGKGGAKAGLGSPQKRGLSHPVGGPGTGRDRYYQSNRNGWLTMLFTSHLAVQPSYAYLLPLRFHPEITMAS